MEFSPSAWWLSRYWHWRAGTVNGAGDMSARQCPIRDYLASQSVVRSYSMARRHDVSRSNLDGRIYPCLTLAPMTKREMTAWIETMASAMPDWRVWSYDCERD
jgi:hypothetical protein